MSNSTRDAGIVLGQSTGRRIVVSIVACALASGIFLAALPMLAPAAGAQDQNVVTVPIRDFFFDPADITVASGTTVMWVNEGSRQHTVTSDDGQFDSEALMPGDSFMVTFTGSGTLTYHCEIHPETMVGSVTVGGEEAALANEPAASADRGASYMPMDSGYMGSGY